MEIIIGTIIGIVVALIIFNTAISQAIKFLFGRK